MGWVDWMFDNHPVPSGIVAIVAIAVLVAIVAGIGGGAIPVP